jgi:NADH:ubiquinone oxidoreductase subunit D
MGDGLVGTTGWFRCAEGSKGCEGASVPQDTLRWMMAELTRVHPLLMNLEHGAFEGQPACVRLVRVRFSLRLRRAIHRMENGEVGNRLETQLSRPPSTTR